MAATARTPVWRVCALLAASTTLWIAGGAPLTELTHVLLIAHMIQHLLLMLIAPPLLLLGWPVIRTWARRLWARPPGQDPPGRLAGARGALRRLTHPVAAGGLMVSTTIAWHVPRLFALAMRSPAWHGLENATFFATGLLFWWPVIPPWPSRRHWPRWAIPLYLFGADAPLSVLTAYLAFCGRLVYPCYSAVSRPWSLSALDDQVAAALLMWAAMLVVFLGASVAVVVDLLENP